MEDFKDIVIAVVVFFLIVGLIGLSGSIATGNNKNVAKIEELYNEIRVQDSTIIILKTENVKLNKQIELLLEYNKDKK